MPRRTGSSHGPSPSTRVRRSTASPPRSRSRTAVTALTLVETLAAYVARTRVTDLPADVVARAKLCLLDTLGVAIAGSRDRVARTVAAHAATHGSPGRST